MAEISVRIEGLDRLLAKLRGKPAIFAGPLRQALTKSAVLVENTAKLAAPVDTGRMRASHTHKIDGAATPLWAKVGVNTTYASFVHEGTSRMKSRPWLRNALHRARPQIDHFLKAAEGAIEAAWKR